MCTKVSYGYREAHERLNSVRRVHKIRGKKMPKRAYYCAECRQWHLTSSKKFREQFD